MSPALAAYQRRAAVPVTVATILLVPALLLDGASLATWRQLGAILNWSTWLVLAAHVAVVLWLGGVRAGWRLVWFDAVLVLVTVPFAPPPWQTARMLRLLRVVRLGVTFAVALHHVRSVLQHRQFHIVAMIAAVAVALGAVGLYQVEYDANANIRSVGDALWWAVVTATTVGYGDISPVTTEGRVIAVALMLLGIGVIGAFTATVASFFVTQEEAPDFKAMARQLAQLEAKVDVLLARESREAGRRPDQDA